MKREAPLWFSLLLCSLCLASAASATAAEPTPLDRLLAEENEGRQVQVAPPVDDLTFLRRVTLDLIGRIPTAEEIKEYLAWPAGERREKLIDKLLADERFADRWTVFFGDMLRIRSNAEGGAQFMAFVHKALEIGMSYDEMSRRLISANGKPGRTPEVGFILGDNADPMALAGTTAQVFMGVRIACAQCHDHPFDVWTREQFYGFAAYFGKTRRIESQLTQSVYTTEGDQTTILWPPEDEAKGSERTAMKPAFPFQTVAMTDTPDYIARLEKLRVAQEQAQEEPTGPNIDDLLASTDAKVNKASGPADPLDVVGEATKERSKIDILGDLYKVSQLRSELAAYITSPRNRYFAKALVNRLWADLFGRGFVDPVDDFSEENQPSHPRTLDYLADEFVAGGFDFRNLVKMVVSSEAYQRGRLTGDDTVREAAEDAFTSFRMRRMLAETLFDSIAQAGHLLEYKYPAGANKKVVRQLTRVAVPREGAELDSLTTGDNTASKEMPKPMIIGGAYDLESAIEVDFDKLLMKEDETPDLAAMQAMSKEELEAMQMMRDRENNNPTMRYVERYVDFEVDDNPLFSSSLRMASPADPAHFVRIFGQPARQELGDARNDNASMRQALMMLNGKLTHEASRVGDFEPVFPLIAGPKANVDAAVGLVYREILTREPSTEEVAEAKEIISAGETPRDGLADLRWVLFNCHEFRFVP